MDFETIVVDNASTDGSREMLAIEFPQVKAVCNDINRGFAAANNQGIRLAQGRYILLLNSDTIILDWAVEKVLGYMIEHPEASIVGCKLLNREGTLQPSCRSFPSLWYLFSEASFLYLLFKRTQIFGEYHMSNFDHDSARRVDFVMGAFMMIKREVFERAGLLDETYFMYTEETDFCYRAAQQGFQVHFTPSAQIVHYGGGSTETRQSYFDQIHLTQILFIRKHFRGIKKYFGVLLKQFGIALRVLVYGLIGLLCDNRSLRQKSLIYAKVLYKTMR
jgi:GT2 family glycosyltransferase